MTRLIHWLRAIFRSGPETPIGWMQFEDAEVRDLAERTRRIRG